MQETADPRIQRTRERVLGAALELLHEQGPEAVTHQRVAKRADVGRATVYRHWPDRWDLIFDAFETLPMSLAVPPDLSVRDSLIALLETLCDRLDSPLSLAMASLVSRAAQDGDAQAFLDRIIARAESEVSRLLARDERENGLTVDMPAQTALSLMAGPFFYERLVGGRILSRDQIPAHIDTLMARWGAQR